MEKPAVLSAGMSQKNKEAVTYWCADQLVQVLHKISGP